MEIGEEEEEEDAKEKRLRKSAFGMSLNAATEYKYPDCLI